VPHALDQRLDRDDVVVAGRARRLQGEAERQEACLTAPVRDVPGVVGGFAWSEPRRPPRVSDVEVGALDGTRFGPADLSALGEGDPAEASEATQR
jgi:hypothetical protein